MKGIWNQCKYSRNVMYIFQHCLVWIKSTISKWGSSSFHFSLGSGLSPPFPLVSPRASSSIRWMKFVMSSCVNSAETNGEVTPPSFYFYCVFPSSLMSYIWIVCARTYECVCVCACLRVCAWVCLKDQVKVKLWSVYHELNGRHFNNKYRYNTNRNTLSILDRLQLIGEMFLTTSLLLN